MASARNLVHNSGYNMKYLLINDLVSVSDITIRAFSSLKQE